MSLVVHLNTSLDKLSGYPIVLCLFEEKLPLHGYPGVIDWEVCGELSRIIAFGKFNSREKEKLLLRLKFSCFPGRKVLVYGLGSKNKLTPEKLASLTEDLLHTLSQLSIYSLIYVIPVLYDVNTEISNLLDSLAYSIVKFTSMDKAEYKFWLMWDNVSPSNIVSSFKDAINIIPDASFPIIEKED